MPWLLSSFLSLQSQETLLGQQEVGEEATLEYLLAFATDRGYPPQAGHCGSGGRDHRRAIEDWSHDCGYGCAVRGYGYDCERVGGHGHGHGHGYVKCWDGYDDGSDAGGWDGLGDMDGGVDGGDARHDVDSLLVRCYLSLVRLESLSLILLGRCDDGAALGERVQAKRAQCENVREHERAGAGVGAGARARGHVHDHVHGHAYVGTSAGAGDGGGGGRECGREKDVREDEDGRVHRYEVMVALTLAID